MTTRVLLVSVGMQIVLELFLLKGSEHRSMAMFNNPNQLGYFALLSACMILVIAQRRAQASVATIRSRSVLACSYLACCVIEGATSIGLLMIAFLLGRLRTMLIAGVCLLVLVFTSNFSGAIDRARKPGSAGHF